MGVVGAGTEDEHGVFAEGWLGGRVETGLPAGLDGETVEEVVFGLGLQSS